jgi:hypothetical protein
VFGALTGLAACDFDGCFLESDMSNEPQIRLVMERLNRNLDECTEMIKRTGDRILVILGATIAAFGLIVRLSDIPSSGCALWLLLGSSVTLSVCFIAAIIGLMPKSGIQPGSTDVDELWRDVAVDLDSAAANIMNDVCNVIRDRRRTNERMVWWLRILLIAASITLALVALSQVMASLA